MNKIFFSVFAICILLAGFAIVVADSDQGNHDDDSGMMGDNSNDDIVVGGDKDEHGCLVSAGYSWNDSEDKCVKEWETGEERYQEMEQERERVRDGEHMDEEGHKFMVETHENNQIRLEANGVDAECDCNMTQEQIQNKTKLKVQLSNGKNAEIKVMPDVASERALERLRLKVCSEENNCSLELKEVGKGDQTQLAYELQTKRQAKFLGLFGTKMEVKAQVNAENGEVINIDKPWWAFLASEPAEE